jgi:sodium transport system ATP-binding protein
MSTLVEARGLSKRFGNFNAVHPIHFQVQAGEVIGLLGPNGAGKTTTLRMLAGLLKPTAGEALIAGHSMNSDPLAARKELGFLTGDMDVYRRLTPVEVLKYFGRLYDVPEKELSSQVKTLVELFGITDFKDKHCEKLSTGQKQRTSIARTLVHNPKVVVLDEPTTGLDIMSSEVVLQFIRGFAKQEGKAVIFSTHHLDEVERLCDRVGIIHKGSLVVMDTIPNIKAQAEKPNLAESFFHFVNENNHATSYN